MEPSSLASVLLNLIASNFRFKPFKITPGHRKAASQQLMRQVEYSLVTCLRRLKDSRRRRVFKVREV